MHSLNIFEKDTLPKWMTSLDIRRIIVLFVRCDLLSLFLIAPYVYVPLSVLRLPSHALAPFAVLFGRPTISDTLAFLQGLN